MLVYVNSKKKKRIVIYVNSYKSKRIVMKIKET